MTEHDVSGRSVEGLLTDEELAEIAAGNDGLGEYRSERDREFLDGLVWRGNQIRRLLDHASQQGGSLILQIIDVGRQLPAHRYRRREFRGLGCLIAHEPGERE